MPASRARLIDLEMRAYREVWDLQHRLHDRVSAGVDPQTWIFVEHRPVVTLGRNASDANVLLGQEALAAQGIDFVRIERGGDVTYHGPGQLVVYPICRLERFREVVPLVRALEDAVSDACRVFGVRTQRSDHAGLWVGPNQLCAVGLAIKAMTSLHGIALNVSTDLSYDRLINPCGLKGCGLTSLSREAGRAVTMNQVKTALRSAIERRFELCFEELALAS